MNNDWEDFPQQNSFSFSMGFRQTQPGLQDFDEMRQTEATHQILMSYPIGSMYGIYANIGGILMVNVTIYSIYGSYGYRFVHIIRKTNPLIFWDATHPAR
jgi:hypothetical protein